MINFWYDTWFKCFCIFYSNMHNGNVYILWKNKPQTQQPCKRLKVESWIISLFVIMNSHLEHTKCWRFMVELFGQIAKSERILNIAINHNKSANQISYAYWASIVRSLKEDILNDGKTTNWHRDYWFYAKLNKFMINMNLIQLLLFSDPATSPAQHYLC